MKKLLLFLCGLSLVVSSHAQTFITESGNFDTVKGYWTGIDEITIYNKIKSATANDVVLKWHLTNVTLGANWTFDGFCDNYTCNPSPTLNVNNTSDGYGINYEDFHVIFGGVNAAPMGSYSVVKVNVKDTANTTNRDLTFIGYKNALGVPSVITSYDDVIIFPNPARDAVNVIFNEKAGVKTIAVYNLIGKVLNVYRPTYNGSAKLDIDNIPSGVYFLRLMDGQGHVLATRRFTRQ